MRVEVLLLDYYVINNSETSISVRYSNYTAIEHNVVINNTEGIIIAGESTNNILSYNTIINKVITSQIPGYLFVTALFTSGLVINYRKRKRIS